MLPDDSKARRQALHEKLSQTTVDNHYMVQKPEEKPIIIPYSDERFRDAAIQWFVEMDQVSSILC